jgi:type IV pilus assembly protein PilB
MKDTPRRAVDREWLRRSVGGPPGIERRKSPPAAPAAVVTSSPPSGNGDTPAPAGGRRFSDYLLTEGVITTEQLGELIIEQKRTGEKLPAVLVRLGWMTEDEVVVAQSRHYRIPAVEWPAEPIAPEILRLVPAAIARKHEVIPVGRSAGTLTLAMVDPTNLLAVDDVGFRTGMRVFPVIGKPSLVRAAIEQHYETQGSTLASALNDAEAHVANAVPDEGSPLDLRASADQAPVVRLVSVILLDAIARGASDIHLEPGEQTFHVRFRVDGVLQDVMTPAKRLEPAVVSRIKIMANLDIVERRLPQDGRFKFRDTTREIDLRVSVIPSIFGESVVLRLLDRSALKLDLGRLGLEERDLAELQKAVRHSHGMILVTGPTGSGKTTTLYSALQTLNSPDVHILTLEDPVEYSLPRVNQMQVNEEVGFTFASGLRSALRHDPDIILVGEMRDGETAQIANRAALTGHLVLSTLHTNDAPSTIARLLDMGLAPFLLASSLRLVVAQRLARKVCDDCREPYELDEEALIPNGHSPQGLGMVTLWRGRGCAACSHTGLRGRTAIYEVMPVTREIRDLILDRTTPDEIRKVARDQGMRTLREAGLLKALRGVTSVEEVLRVTVE